MTGLVLPYELKTEAQILFEKTGGFRRGYLQCRYGQTLEGNPLYPCGAGIFGTGANMVFHRDTLREIGGFDLALDTGRPLPGGGDLDIYYRMIRANQVFIYEPTFAVHHQHRLEMAQLRRQYWSWGLGLMAYIMKSISQDPPMRLLFVRLIGWWFKYQLKRLKRSLLGKDIMPISFVLIELWGGIQGALGSYGRSQRRIAKIQASTTEDVQTYQTLQLES